jgi:hypothetical protein
MTLEECTQITTIVGVIVAVVTYVTTSKAQSKQRSIDNAIRYWDCHSGLFSPDSYIHANLKAMEAGTYNRDESDSEMELKFHALLSTCEHIVLLQKAGGLPKSINAYMFGWFAKKIYPVLTDHEKAEPYWELAVDFLKETKLEAEKLDAMSKKERLAYLDKITSS